MKSMNSYTYTEVNPYMYPDIKTYMVKEYMYTIAQKQKLYISNT